jgi:hypothetical protein
MSMAYIDSRRFRLKMTVSVLIDEDEMELAVRVLHTAYGLDMFVLSIFKQHQHNSYVTILNII